MYLFDGRLRLVHRAAARDAVEGGVVALLHALLHAVGLQLLDLLGRGELELAHAHQQVLLVLGVRQVGAGAVHTQNLGKEKSERI